MTIARSFVGYGGYPYGTDVLPYATTIGREYCADRVTIWTSVDPELSPQPLHHRYIPVDLPVAADQWGVSYPAGTKLLVDTTAVYSSRLATIEADWQNWWNGNFQNHGVFNLSSDGYLAVPATLPVGYTERLKRDWHFGQASIYDWAAASGASVRTYNLRTATGFTRHQWMPNRYAWGYTQALSAVHSGGAVVGSKYFDTIETSTGYRKLQYQLSFLNSGGSAFAFPGSVIFKVSHNADGTAAGVTSDGDTTDYTGTHSAADFTHSPGIDATGWIDAGAILPTLGTISQFRGSVDATGTGLGTGVSVSLRLSPRVDVPAPFTVTDRGGVIVRGGVPT